MTILVHFMLFGWIPAVLALFLLLPPRRAVIAASLFAWLFLPMAGFAVPALPDYTKETATSYGILIGVILFDAVRFGRLRFCLADLVMIVWCLAPMASSLTNGLGPYDGASGVAYHTIIWGFPYLIGRLYFTDLLGLRELAIGIVIGGLLYVPLCLFEVRMSPQLHNWVYGFTQHSFMQTLRFGGYRPMVFMQHGLAVALWMAVSTLMAFWLWRTRSLVRLFRVPMWMLCGGLLVTTVLCKSLGALTLLAVGIAALLAVQLTRSAAVVIPLVLIVPLYLVARVGVGWSAEPVVEAVRQVSEERAESFRFRIHMEDRLIGRALERPAFGWGGWGRSTDVRDEEREVVTDSLWIIALGQRGLVGLVAVTGVLLMPAIVLMNRTRMRHWDHAAVAPAAALVIVVLMFAIDNLVNHMFNPVFVMAVGGLVGLSVPRPRRAANRPVAATQRAGHAGPGGPARHAGSSRS